MTARSTRQAGFTLLEVLVALAILSLAVVASIQAFAQGLRLLKLAGDHQHATLLADEKMREVVDVQEGRDEGTEGRLRWERTTRVIETPDLTPADGPRRGTVYEIDVRVTWDVRRQVEIRTLRLVPPVTAQAGTGVSRTGVAPGAATQSSTSGKTTGSGLGGKGGH